MASPAIPEALRGYVLSAADLRAMTDWPEALIEDYLNLYNNLLTLASVINQKNDLLKTVRIITPAESPYEIASTDEEVFFDTTLGTITANLQEGTDGRNYRLINIGLSGNAVTVNPFGTEELFGVNSAEMIYDQEALIITFDSAGGWN